MLCCWAGLKVVKGRTMTVWGCKGAAKRGEGRGWSRLEDEEKAEKYEGGRRKKDAERGAARVCVIPSGTVAVAPHSKLIRRERRARARWSEGRAAARPAARSRSTNCEKRDEYENFIREEGTSKGS